MELGFIIKKIISAWLMPLPLGMLLALFALWSLWHAHIKRAKWLLLTALLWITLITYAPFANALIFTLEVQYPQLNKIPKDIEYILLLGGDKRHRGWEALRLYRQRPNLKIITSGYSRYDTISEAEKSAKLLIHSGVKQEDIVVQKEVKDTEEEAEAIKKRIGKQPFILVTSAYHMPRAMMIFRQKGLSPIPAPTEFHTSKPDDIIRIFQSKQLKKSEQALHEFLGIIWLKIKSL